MKLDERQRAYWRRNLSLTLTLLSVWFVVTFVGGFYAAELNTLSFLGFPLGFYLFAQGSLLIYLVIIVIYVFAMNRLDRQFRIDTRR
jgi:putative solute:sodium symporter small subunit